MATIGERELRERAAIFINALQEADIHGELVETAFRDWQAKVSLVFNGDRLGNVILYYKKNGNFTLGVQELKDKRFNAQIQAYWNGKAALPSVIPDITEQTSIPEPTQLRAYVDGSYVDGKTGYGAIIVDGGDEVGRFSGIVEEADGTRQVAGELQATMAVLTWCLDHQVSEIGIYYDYEGIEKWASGVWRAKQALTQAYVNFLRQCPVKIRWSKVESHSGDYWNDIADQLAKQGAQMSPKTTTPSAASDRIEADYPYSEVEYYYHRLSPYRDLAFDFIALASAIKKEFAEIDSAAVDVIAYRYDFNYLEHLYMQLKESLLP